MKKNKLMSAALAALLITASVNAPASFATQASSFTDVKESDWYYSFAENAKAKGILAGYPDGSFRPDNTVTYGEFLVMILKGESSSAAGSHWASGFYARALEKGLLYEDEVSVRQLSDPIPRKDMAVMMARKITEYGLGGSNAPGADTLYSDVARFDPCEYAISLCSYYGVLNGYPDMTFRPLGYLKRSEAAAAMLALEDILANEKPLQVPIESEILPETIPEEPSGIPSSREELMKVEISYIDEHADESEIKKYMNPKLYAFISSVLESSSASLSEDNCEAHLSWPSIDINWGDDSRYDSVKIEYRAISKDESAVTKEGFASYKFYELRAAGEKTVKLDSKEISAMKPGFLMIYVTAKCSGETAIGYISYDISKKSAEKGYILKGRIEGSPTDAGYSIEALNIPCSAKNFDVK